ncbi:MBL fold metallo-hydrolase [candidate division TA06 bacterium]|uniref:MBL fold metallo-hydrolase n=1 Tax=candidate division TA06 bacterium TaxID=2250710 RepID=A0A523UUR2_UNCT6|nr:MAG: MBL fold metallo-hydrolase [candidate division TA06 bacterium]
MEIVPGVHRIDGLVPNNSYLIVDGDPILIDTGFPGNCPRILRYLCSLGIRKTSLKAVVLTHFHIDHMGSAGRVAVATGAEVWAHELDAPSIEGKRPDGGYGSILGLCSHTSSRLVKVPVHRRLTGGDMIECLGGLEVIHAPGHTEGSICLYQAKRGILFSGNTVLYSLGKVMKPIWAFNRDNRQLDDSMEKISKLTFEYMLPGDGKPLLGGAACLLRQFVKKQARSTRSNVRGAKHQKRSTEDQGRSI